jgi:3-oxoacyl-[acyl-carrier-protein] synthase III
MEKTRVCLLGFGEYLPERVMSNDEWAQYVDTTDEWLTTRTGIKRRRESLAFHGNARQHDWIWISISEFSNH